MKPDVHASGAALWVLSGGLMLGAVTSAVSAAEHRSSDSNPIGWLFLGAAICAAALGTYLCNLP
jgi:hypothetical protein